MAATKLVLILLFLLLRYADSQCMQNCNCALLPNVCCLVVEEDQPPTVVGYDNSSSTAGIIAGYASPRYAFQGTDLDGIFEINPTTGQISTLRRLDRETETLTTTGNCISSGIEITEEGGLNENTIGINIVISDVNDNPPVFPQSHYIIEIPETTIQDDGQLSTVDCSPQLLRATDADEGENAQVRYRLGPDAGSLFMIHDPTEPCVVNAPGVDLDRDVPPSNYSFTLIAEDQANSSLSSETLVTYVLQDVNDNSPIFENDTYNLRICEDLMQMSKIYQFVATDIDLGRNGGTDLIYSISSGDAPFQVNQTTGYLILSRPLERNADAENSRYELTVTATDTGIGKRNSGSATVIINVMDVNEKAIISLSDISTPVLEITENEDFEGVIAYIEFTDSDREESNQGNTISVIGNSVSLFTVQMVPLGPDQVLALTQISPVDYEQNRTIQIQLESTEQGNPVINQIFLYNLTVINVNDNSPDLNVKEFRFAEDYGETRSNRPIVDLSDYVFDDDDVDSSVVVSNYKLVSVTNSSSDDLTSYFLGALNEGSGVLSTENFGMPLDREVFGDCLNFRVNLTDLGNPPRSQVVDFTVILEDLNDNSPMFVVPRYSFNLTENQPRFTPIGTVHADDPDYLQNGTVIYTILQDSPESSQFSINSATGDLTSGAEFNREKCDRYQITIQAHDDASPQRMAEPITVNITILDVNDLDPIFAQERQSFTIDTNHRSGHVIGTVTATDRDKEPNNVIVYKLESPSSLFSLQSNSTGTIVLASALSASGEESYTLNVSAFNPGRENNKDTINVVITVKEADPFTIPVIGGIAGAAAFFIILIVIVIGLIMCFCYKNRKYKRRYNMKELNNAQKTIMKVPTTNGQQPRSRVTFNESVQETHYNEQSVVTDTDNTIRKESITKFDNSPREHRPFTSTIEEEDGPPPMDHHCQPERLDVVELEMSPGHMINGDIPIPAHHRNYNNMRQPRPHSPIVRVVNGGPREDGEFSQGTSSDGHTYMDDEESMFSDDASIVNTAISRYGNERHHDLDTQYGTPSTHSHLELHHHLPPMSHGQPTNSSLAQLHAHNLAQLAEANRHQHYGSLLNGTSEHSHSLTLTPHNHTSISTQSTHSRSPPSPHHSRSHLGAVAERGSTTNSNHLHSSTVGVGSGRKYTHPLVMPDAFPGDTTDIHRFPIGSYAEDYGEASTYASTELDEALGFNLDAEPGIISLTATTDYEEDTML